MKKIFFLILFCLPAFLFAQIVKPGVVIDSSGYIIAKQKPTKYEANEYWLNGSPFVGDSSIVRNIGSFNLMSILKGYNSGNNISTTINIPINNIGLGFNNFDSTTQYMNNTIGIGYQNFYSFTNAANGFSSSEHNIGIGYQTFYNFKASQASNSGNIGIGFQSLYSFLYGDENIAIGTNALYALAGAYGNFPGYNIAIGYGAMGAYSFDSTINNANVVIGGYCGQNLTHGRNDTYIGSNVGTTSSDESNMIRIGNDANTGHDFMVGNMNTSDLYIKANVDIDSLGHTIRYHTISGQPNRTAGIDSLLNGTDTVYTTAYDANSLVFITNLSIGTGLTYVNKAISLAGSYFVVTSTILTDTNKFNWFILKTY